VSTILKEENLKRRKEEKKKKLSYGVGRARAAWGVVGMAWDVLCKEAWVRSVPVHWLFFIYAFILHSI